MYKSRHISLILLWSLGLVMLIIVSVPIFSQNNKRDADIAAIRELQESRISDLNVANSNAAYVFVTINKKHFLTRFPSYIPAEKTVQADVPVPTDVTVSRGPDVERIRTRIKPAVNKKPADDFTIKPAPLE